MFQSAPASCEAGDTVECRNARLPMLFQSAPASCEAGDANAVGRRARIFVSIRARFV